MKEKTIGEIAKSHGFDSVSSFFNAIDEEIKIAKNISFNIGDEIRLKSNYKPTHFKKEEVLPKDTNFIVYEKSNFTLDNYHVKIEGYDEWFHASVFELCP